MAYANTFTLFSTLGANSALYGVTHPKKIGKINITSPTL
jgi:hypothetical protein